MPCTSPCAKHIGKWVLTATILGSSMAFVNSASLNVALPAMQVQLSATVADMQWVVEAYALFVAALLLVGGSLGDRFGRRRVFVIGTVLSAVASVICMLATDVQQLIWARGVQGMGDALLVPGSLAIIGASFPKDQRGGAIGLWSGFTAINSSIGSILGGWLVENFSWRWMFAINLPLAVVVLVACFYRVPESRDCDAKAHLDWQGAVLAAVGLGCIVFGLLEASKLGLQHPWVIGSLAAGGAIALAFLTIEARSVAPMMPLTLFRSATFSSANVLTLLLYAALSSAMFVLPFNLIQVQGYSAAAAGAAIVPFPVIMFLLSGWAGGLVTRYGARLPLTVGPAIAGAGFALMAVPGVGGNYWTTFFPAMVVLGLGMTICLAPLTTAVMDSVQVRYAGVASGVNNAVSRIAGLLSVALLGVAIAHAFEQSLFRRIATLNLSPEAREFLEAQRINLAEAEVPPGVSDTVREFLHQAIDLAFIDGFRLVVLTSAGLALLGAVVAATAIGGRQVVTSES